MTRREKLAAAVSIVAVPVALELVVFAIDVLRTPGWIADDDARFTATLLRASGI